MYCLVVCMDTKLDLPLWRKNILRVFGKKLFAEY
jgi:hypothetical protein